jgi:Phytanoyl-CoA dioxygenase (PhyH)
MNIQVKNSYYNWQPIPSTVIKDKKLADTILNKGYDVLDILSEEQVDQLKSIFDKEHQLEIKDGGMFYSLYSKDYDYRKRVNDQIHEILTPLLESLFVDYKNVINSFVIKAPGPKSEFYVHQDTTAMDEFAGSPLSLWIPLHDITTQNGSMCLIEKTHWFFSPYRGVSFSFPFSKINNTIKDYLKPITLKKGEILIFDPRLIHNSLANQSNEHRLAIVCGIFPKDAKFNTCFKDPNIANAHIEIYEHDDDYLLKYPNFFYNCHERPVSGNKIKDIEVHEKEMDAEEFIELCKLNQIPKQEFIAQYAEDKCQMIAEPDGINKFDESPKEETVSAKKGFFAKLFNR